MGRRLIGISGSLIWSKTLMELMFSPCGKFRWSPEGPVSQIHSPHLLVGAPCDLFRSFKVVQMLKREWGAESNGKLPSSSSVARQPCVGLGLPQKLPPFLSVQCYAPPIPISQCPYVLSDTVFPSHLRSSNFPGPFWRSLTYLLHCSLITSTQYKSSPLQPPDRNKFDNIRLLK